MKLYLYLDLEFTYKMFSNVSFMQKLLFSIKKIQKSLKIIYLECILSYSVASQVNISYLSCFKSLVLLIFLFFVFYLVLLF